MQAAVRHTIGVWIRRWHLGLRRFPYTARYPGACQVVSVDGRHFRKEWGGLTWQGFWKRLYLTPAKVSPFRQSLPAPGRLTLPWPGLLCPTANLCVLEISSGIRGWRDFSRPSLGTAQRLSTRAGLPKESSSSPKPTAAGFQCATFGTTLPTGLTRSVLTIEAMTSGNFRRMVRELRLCRC